MSDNKQYHNTRRKRMLRRFKLNQLQAKLERLDEEDRPTGCLLCPMRGDVEIDYKNVRLLSQFVSPHTGRIYGRTLTGLCIKKQKEIAKAIRRARAMGFMPVTMKYLAFHEDPKLF
ncbi:28S ribosomal protein S18c, mitochondrial [Stylophora pistillata]|uniref:Small ribosomal subunit protein bS18m n=2 Tax=Stylophora pistillata TaxID=50429 RepID=A0A2B4SVP3_STYPI|nr:28S ribosomal protein S18c, mitochondrial [Stylophora pistillata]